MYQALYRKYRPRCFNDVAGQEHVTETLRRQIVSDRLSHAYLFVGTRGTGKTTCAKILSRAVNCRNPVDGEPCNACISCVGIENGSILDVLELDAASNSGVDNVRALREEAFYTPASVKKRVYIIDEVHMLSNSAFNALLKILEEPPDHLIFILATTELHKVPATILSRCQRFSFKRLLPAAITKRLNQVAKTEGLILTADAAEKLAALADGSMRDGLSLLDQCASDTTVDLARVLDTIGLAGQQETLRLAAAAVDGDITGTLSILDGLYNDGRDMASLLNELAALMRDILVCKLSPDSPLLSGGFSRKELSGLSKKLTPERLFSCLEVIKDASYSLSRGGSVRLSVEMCLIRICDVRLSDDAAAVLARVAKLEVNSEFEIRNSELSRDSANGVNLELTKDKNSILNSEFAKDENSVLNSEFAKDGWRETGGQVAAPSLTPPKDIDVAAESVVSDKTGAGEATHGGEDADVSSDSEFRIPNSEFKFWHDILELLKSDVPVYALLSDGANVQAELRDGLLIVRATNLFTVSTIESKMFSEPLREAARKILGQEVVVRVEAGGGGIDDGKMEKLERLGKFDIFKFE